MRAKVRAKTRARAKVRERERGGVGPRGRVVVRVGGEGEGGGDGKGGGKGETVGRVMARALVWARPNGDGHRVGGELARPSRECGHTWARKEASAAACC